MELGVVLPRQGNVPDFLIVNSFLWQAKKIGGSRFYFDENQGPFIRRDEIDLAVLTAKVPANDPITQLL